MVFLLPQPDACPPGTDANEQSPKRDPRRMPEKSFLIFLAFTKRIRVFLQRAADQLGLLPQVRG